MTTVASIVDLQITRETATLTRQGFGTTLIAAYHTVFPERVREYSELSEMVTDGFAVTDPAYLAASALKSQDPSPPTFKVGRRGLAPTKTVEIKCLSAVEGQVYSFTLNGVAVTYTVGAAATTTTVATAIELLTEAVTGISSSSATDTITLTHASGAGHLFDISGWDPRLMGVRDVTADPGIATDLAAIILEDNDWYGLVLDSNSEAEVVAAAAWVEANKKIFVSDTVDYDAETAGIPFALDASAYDRSTCIVGGSKLMSYAGAALLGKLLPKDPGSYTAKLKTLAGVPQDTIETLSTSRETAIKAVNANTYTTVAGRGMLAEGVMASGEWFDVIHFIDWLDSNMAIDVVEALARVDKVPFTDAGVDVVRSAVLARLKAGAALGGLDPTSIVVTAPSVASVSAGDRRTRNLPGVSFSARLAGAIHKTAIRGKVSA